MISAPWRLFDGSDESSDDDEGDDEKELRIQETKEETCAFRVDIDDVDDAKMKKTNDTNDERAFRIYFRHHHAFFPFLVMIKIHILVSKFWYRNVARFCTDAILEHVAQSTVDIVPAVISESAMRPSSIVCNSSIHPTLVLKLCSLWRDSLEHLHIQSPSCSDKYWQNILKMLRKKPLSVRLPGCRSSSLSLKTLASKANQLLELDLRNNDTDGIRDFSDKDIAEVLRSSPMLRHLNLSGNWHLSMKCLLGSSTNNLQNLSLETLHVNRDVWESEILGKHRHSLRALNLGRMQCGEDSSFVFSNLSELKEIRTLGLKCVDRANLPLNLLSQLASLPHLRELDLCHSNACSALYDNNNNNNDDDDDDNDDDGSEYFLTNLQVLWLRCSSITDSGLLRVVHVCPILSDLDLGDCVEITENGLSNALCNMNTPLKRLVLDNENGKWELNSEGLGRVLRKHGDNMLALSVIHHSIVRQLRYLSRNLLRLNISGQPFVNFHDFRYRCSRLKSLRLDYCDWIKESDILKYVVTWPSLRVLGMAGLYNTVTDRVVRTLARQNRLYELDIEGCVRVKWSLISIEMSRFHELRYLNVRGVVGLVNAHGGPHQEAGVCRILLNKLPGCRIII